MENGGNLKVNAIFEANLARSGVQKPSNHADGPTRERFIRDKYERRKFYDPASFSNLPQSTRPTAASSSSQQQQEEVVGPPSDVARQRMEQRRLRKMHSAPATDDRGRNHAASTETGVARAPPKVAARSSSSDRNRPRSRTPPRLNAGTKLGQQQPRRAATRRQQSDESLEKEMDLLDLNYVAPPAAAAPEAKQESSSAHDLFNFLVVQDPAQTSGKQQQPQKSSNLDIMSLYSNNSQTQTSLAGFGNMNVSHLTGDVSANMGGYATGQKPHMVMRPNMGQLPANMQQQQQQQQMMMMQQQQMMMMQQQQQQQMMMGNNNMMMMQNNAMHGNHGGFGAPMGSGPPVSSFQGQPVQKAPEKEDPFAQFGVNHFR